MDDDQIGDDNTYRGGERELLKKALAASGMSARQAAGMMDISDTRLRHIINGYQPVGRGQRISVIAPEDTLARIAMALDVTPEELENAGRPDAARELRSRQRELASWGDDSLAVVTAIATWAEDPVNYIPPDDALRFFEDSALLGELERRLGRLREHAQGQVRHGYGDVNGHVPVVPNPKTDNLTVSSAEENATIGRSGYTGPGADLDEALDNLEDERDDPQPIRGRSLKDAARRED